MLPEGPAPGSARHQPVYPAAAPRYPSFVFIQASGTAERTYDAIVVGSGISGGWAAKELTGKGLRTLVLERGRDVKHGEYPTAMLESWQFEGRNRLTTAALATQEKQARTGYTTHPASA